MGDPARISKGEWEVILHAPFQVYSTVAGADGEPSEAQFRRFAEELERSRTAFGPGTIGHTMIQTLTGNLDALWLAYHANGREPRDGLRRLTKALRTAPDDESFAIRDWLLTLAIEIAAARHDMGDDTISDTEIGAMRDVAGWVDRPLPERPIG